MIESNILDRSIFELSKLIKNKEISPVEITKESLKIIEKKDNDLNTFITLMADEALKDAVKAENEILKGDYRGSFHGIPIGLKDMIHMKGVKTTFASEAYGNYIPNYDAEIVTKLKDAGAIIMGKLNMHAFAYGKTGDRSTYGPVRNPHNLNKIVGASSSGSGAAVAGSLIMASIGSDTGGSVRMPASFCGIVGMKPTFGRVSKHGSLALCPTLDHLGPMTKTVKDNALMLNIISGYDQKDPYSIHSNKENFTTHITKGVRGKTIGIPTNFYFDIIDNEVKNIFDLSVERLKEQGAKIEFIEIPGMEELSIAQQTILVTEAYRTLERYFQEDPLKIEEEVRNRAIVGMFIQASEYLQMLEIRKKAIEIHFKILDKVDAIMTPTICGLPSNIGERVMDINGKEESTRLISRLTGPSNTLGFPAISVSGGLSDTNLPVGIQFIGKPFDESLLYQIAYSLEQSADN